MSNLRTYPPTPTHSSSKTPFPKLSTTFPNSIAMWRQTAQKYVPESAFHIQNINQVSTGPQMVIGRECVSALTTLSVKLPGFSHGSSILMTESHPNYLPSLTSVSKDQSQFNTRLCHTHNRYWIQLVPSEGSVILKSALCLCTRMFKFSSTACWKNCVVLLLLHFLFSKGGLTLCGSIFLLSFLLNCLLHFFNIPQLRFIVNLEIMYSLSSGFVLYQCKTGHLSSPYP